MDNNVKYWLCSQQVIDVLNPSYYSSSIEYDGEPVYIMVYDDFNTIKSAYDRNKDTNFWCREIMPANVDCEWFDLDEVKSSKPNLFNHIYEMIDITQPKNVACIIGQICIENNIEPTELFNMLQ